MRNIHLKSANDWNNLEKRMKKSYYDEFYTRYQDIENEINHYESDIFQGQSVLCNCNDNEQSNFFKFFSDNFKKLRLRSIVSISYNPNGDAKKIIIDANGKRIVDLDNDGDFSKNIVDLQSADMVITNPPFSKFKEFVSLLVRYNKKFLILGNMNAISYQEVFSLIKENRISVGYKPFGQNTYFEAPSEYQDYLLVNKQNYRGYKIIDGHICPRVSLVCWFTNLPKQYDEIVFTKRYDSRLYRKYDNYDAINVDKVSDIPFDYNGVIGVPITFLSRYNPYQFKIVGQLCGSRKTEVNFGFPYIDGKKKFSRILIINKN